MKEDYLWDKTGGDLEIKLLEDVLAVLRYQETPAPALPVAEVVRSAAKAPKRKFVLSLAFAALAAVVAVVSFWFRIPTSDIASDQALRSSDSVHIKSIVEPGNDSILETVKNTNQVPARNVVKEHPLVPSVFQQNRTAAKPPARKKRVVTLTREEKYAYEQLLLALSITGSKLKIVQDRVNGVEDPKTIVTENNR